MPDELPPGAIARLGSTAYRLTDRYGTVFLMPPAFRSYVAADDTGAFREFDLTTGKPGRTILKAEPPRKLRSVTPDGKCVATADASGCSLIDIATQKVIASAPAEPEAWGMLSPDGRRVAFAHRNPDMIQREADYDTEGTYVRVFVFRELKGRTKLREIRPLANYNVGGNFSPDGRWFATFGEWKPEIDDQKPPFVGSCPIQVWDVATGKELLRLTPPEKVNCTSASFTADGHLFVINSDRGCPLGFYSVETGERVHKFPGRNFDTRGTYAVSPDGTVVACLDRQNTVIRWDVAAGKKLDQTTSPIKVGEFDSTYTRDFVVGPDGTVTVLQVFAQTVMVWTAPERRVLTRTVGGSAPIKAIAYADGGQEIRTAGKEPVVRRWDASTGELLGEVTLSKNMHQCTAIVHFMGDWLLAESRYGRAAFNLKTKKPRLFPPEQVGSQCVSFTPDGRLVELSLGGNPTPLSEVRIRHLLEDGSRLVHRFDGTHPAVAISGSRMLLMFDDRVEPERTLVCFHVEKDRVRKLWERYLPIGLEYQRGFDPHVRIYPAKVGFILPEAAILWAPDGATALLLPYRERIPLVIDPTTGDTVTRWKTAIRGPHAVHPTQPILATSSPEGDTLTLTDWRTGKQLAIVAEAFYPHALAWSPDGTRLVASLPDGTACMFDANQFIRPRPKPRR